MSFFVKWADINYPPVRFLCSADSLSAWLSRFLRWLCYGIFLLMVCFSSSSLATLKIKQNRKPVQAKQEESKARGVILRFYRWPSLKQQREIERILTGRGLKKTKDIKSFKAQLFEWTQGELKLSTSANKTVIQTKLKPSVEAEKACLKLKDLSYVRRCSPDTLLSLNSFKDTSRFLIAKSKPGKKSKTEADFAFECETCKNQGIQSIEETVKEVASTKTCDLIPNKQNLMGGKLSDYWAQELIGSDLVREELEKTDPPDIENWIAVFDSKARDHNIHVKNLISDEGRHAVLPKIREKISFLETYETYGRTDGKQYDSKVYREGKRYQSALSVYDTSYPGDYLTDFKERPPRYINNSMDWAESKDIYEVFEKLSSSLSNTIVVVASGNSFPKKLGDIQSKASKNDIAILVGSFSPSGFISEFSQSGKEVHILAPSDGWITSADKNGNYKRFSGTSGAAPLVTGSLASFEWLSGYHPTAKEAKILLEKTALPSLHSHEKPQVNGAGLLNAYKLAEVAKRLKKKCGNDSSCFKKEILKDETYQFPKDQGLKTELSKAFPSCSSQKDRVERLTEIPNCEKKAEVFKRLRISVLLNPSKESLGILSCLYREGGFTKNAEALDKLAMALGTEAELRAEIKTIAEREKSISDNTIRLMLGMGGFEEEFELFKYRPALKMASGLGEKGLSLLERGFDTGNRELQKQALSSAGWMGEKGLPLLEKGFNTNNIELQEAALFSAGRIGEKGLPLIERGFNTGNRELQKQALYSAFWIGEKALPLLERGFDTNNIELQKAALSSASGTREKGLPLIERGFNTGNRELQKQALSSASVMGEKALPLLERGFNTGNRELQKEALSSAGWMEEKGLPLLEKGFNTGNRELQKEALSSARWIGEKGLPLIERGFNTNDIELQKEALSLTREMGEKAVPMLKRVLKNKNVDQKIKEDIKKLLEFYNFFKQQHTQA